MTTMVLSAAGAAVGGALNGSLFGVSTAELGRLAGATIGYGLGARGNGGGASSVSGAVNGGSEPVETGRIDRFRVSGVSEGAPIPLIFGRCRVAGQVIWASQFEERLSVSRTGSPANAGASAKGAPAALPTEIRETHSYSYMINIAIALCEGPIASVDRIWADGVLVPREHLNISVYHGAEDQLPDPRIEAIEGEGQVPAYRGLAYVVIEDLELGFFGNRVPNFSFEVTRIAPDTIEGLPAPELAQSVKAVALMPGSGEFTLATTPIRVESGAGKSISANRHSPMGVTDIEASLDQLTAQAPNLEAVSLVTSWFGDDLRAGHCKLKPKIELSDVAGKPWDWEVCGIERAFAERVPMDNDRPVYGGTPADRSVIEAIRDISRRGLKVLFYPFILMEQMADNSLPDPYSGAPGQPALPWRGRITTALAPGVEGSPDGTTVAEDEVASFFGTAQPGDWQLEGDTLTYSGPEEWSLRRMILHYAWLCVQAGGVESFCIGSEMRGLTQIRGVNNSFPAVAALRQLAADVRQIVGPFVKIGYAADWSEYFGYAPVSEPGNRFFHLDPLWADENIDFIGIDNYMPLSDWREGTAHLDGANAQSIYDISYLMQNIEGGEGYDWYYASDLDRADQIRSKIQDSIESDSWIWRFKDLRNWWSSFHHDRVNGQKIGTASPWVPQSKPFWFTELGCAAIDKATNQPNKFLDPKSSESSLPYFSSAARDDLIQAQYYRAMDKYFSQPENNPLGSNPLQIPEAQQPYRGPMVNVGRSFAWAWDARPYPYFPRQLDVWSDGENYRCGHWLNGRISNRALEGVVAEICQLTGLRHFDVSGLHGVVRGYVLPSGGTARAALQPLAQAFGFDAIEDQGKVVFRMRDGRVDHDIAKGSLALLDELPSGSEFWRGAAPEREGRMRLAFTEIDGEFGTLVEEASFADEDTHAISGAEFPMALTRAEGRGILERWLAESRIGTERIRVALPPSFSGVTAGDVIRLEHLPDMRWRIDRIEGGAVRIAEAVRVTETSYSAAELEVDQQPIQTYTPPLPVVELFMDLPYMGGSSESEVAPWVAFDADPWPGSVALYAAGADTSFELNKVVAAPSITGSLLTPLVAHRTDVIDRHSRVRVHLERGALSSCSEAALLGGGNLAAIGDGTASGWEIIQFRDAVLQADGSWEISQLVRGRFGSEVEMRPTWPQGARFVLLDGLPGQIAFSITQLRQPLSLRWGPGAAPEDDPSYEQGDFAFAGQGLRPYRPVHLRAEWVGGDLELTWLRRTRKGGDNWEVELVPIGESQLSFQIRVIGADGVEAARFTASEERFVYPEHMRIADGVGTSFRIEVAQISLDYGSAGPGAGLNISTV